jgi:hypothetical protein
MFYQYRVGNMCNYYVGWVYVDICNLVIPRRIKNISARTKTKGLSWKITFFNLPQTQNEMSFHLPVYRKHASRALWKRNFNIPSQALVISRRSGNYHQFFGSNVCVGLKKCSKDYEFRRIIR